MSLPTRNSTVRMRLWRALKNSGCAVLRDGVYILPAGAPQVSAFMEMEPEVQAGGGFAMTVRLTIDSARHIAHARALFERNEDYGRLVREIGTVKARLRRLGERKAQTTIQRVRRALDDLIAIDFYPGEAQSQAREALAALELAAAELFNEGEPRAAKARLRRIDPGKYRGRTWATRKHPWVDRLASAWLIKRFIDKQAKLIWIEGRRDRPKDAVGFDFDGAEFTHTGHRVTFEVLLASFGLVEDSALASIAAAVHYLDVGGIPVPDAKGLETLLTGLRKQSRSDDQLTREAGRVFDALYSAYGEQRTE
jgi:hypothetical protein